MSQVSEAIRNHHRELLKRSGICIRPLSGW
jgi:hypothetical protein